LPKAKAKAKASKEIVTIAESMAIRRQIVRKAKEEKKEAEREKVREKGKERASKEIAIVAEVMDTRQHSVPQIIQITTGNEEKEKENTAAKITSGKQTGTPTVGEVVVT